MAKDQLYREFSRYEGIMEDPQGFWACLKEPLPVTLWVNPLKAEPELLEKELQARGGELSPIPWYPGAYRLKGMRKPGATLPFLCGWYHLQEEISLLPVVVLAPQPGERVMDLCAAPGGKTAQIALKLGGQGVVVACERTRERLPALVMTCKRLSLLNVGVVHGDSALLPPPEGGFDRVLVDAPCSGEGTIRKGKQTYYGENPAFRQRLVKMQEALLRNALRIVRPGGVVVYCTCTFAPEENEEVLHRTLEDWGEVEPWEVPGLRSSPGVTHWEGKRFREDLRHAQRFFPHYNDTGGFFIARIRRSPRPYPPLPQGRRREGRHPFTLLGEGEAREMLAPFCQRFGVEPELFASSLLLRSGRGKHWLAEGGVASLAGVPYPFELLGLKFLEEKGRRGLKPATPVLQRFGKHLKRSVVELREPEKLKRFLRGETLLFPSHPGYEPGYVHVRYPPYELGCGYLGRGKLEPQMPRFMREALQAELAP